MSHHARVGQTTNKKQKMKASEIVQKLQSRKGQHVGVQWSRVMKTRAGVGSVIIKSTRTFVRAGIDYANLSSVKAEGRDVESLPWGEWVQFPFTIAHKGVDYVRLYPAVFANLRPVVTYSIDGRVASAEEVRPLCLASEFRDSDDAPKCFTVKAESIVAIDD